MRVCVCACACACTCANREFDILSSICYIFRSLCNCIVFYIFNTCIFEWNMEYVIDFHKLVVGLICSYCRHNWCIVIFYLHNLIVETSPYLKKKFGLYFTFLRFLAINFNKSTHVIFKLNK